jgi:hypothetical protein
MYRHEGQCIASCPAGFTGSGTGTFGRFCEASAPVRRSIFEADVTATQTSSTHRAAALSSMLGVAFVVAFVAAVLRTRASASTATKTSPVVVDRIASTDLEEGLIASDDAKGSDATTPITAV